MNATISRYLSYTKSEIDGMTDEEYLNTYCHIQVIMDKEQEEGKKNE